MNAYFNSRFLIGLLICSCLGFFAITLTDRFTSLSSNGLGSLTIAIILGITLGNLPFLSSIIKKHLSGIQFTKQRILRLGIILYGLRLTFQDISDVGFLGAAIDIAVFLSTFTLAVYLGVKYFKLDKDIAILIGAGSAICGAAAVLATEPVVKAENEKVTVAISTVVIFGTVSIFLYPILYQLSHHYFASIEFPMQFGIYIGSTVHEVAQVLAAAKSVGSDVADTAVITKMMRVMMLGPFLIALSIYYTYLMRGEKVAQSSHVAKKTLSSRIMGSGIPWFAFLFVLVIALNSLAFLPKQSIQPLVYFDSFLLAAAMAALGLTTHLSAIKNAGLKPLFLASILFFWLVFGGAFINIIATVFWNLS
jgi:uncharacterized integral membrane protein (TIGR00698 family)